MKVRLPMLLLGVMCSAGCSGCRKPLGEVELRVPEEGIRSLAWVRLDRAASSAPVLTASNVTPVIRATLPAGEYRVLLGFANSNYQAPTEVDAGRLAVSVGKTNVFACGLLAFDVRRDLPDLNLEAILVRGPDGTPTIELHNTGNTYYFFLPKPVPPGTYDVAICYSRSTGPSIMATGVMVRAGETASVPLDSGMVLRPPAGGKASVTGWCLTPRGAAAPWLSVKRGTDNDEPLWRRFMVPPGVYELSLESTPPIPAETVTVLHGATLNHTPGIAPALQAGRSER